MTANEMFRPEGSRIVAQGATLVDLYVLTCGEADVVHLESGHTTTSSRRAHVRREGWVLKRRNGWYQRDRRRYLKVTSGELLYTSLDPADPKFDDAKDWNSQPLSGRNTVSHDGDDSGCTVVVDDPCDASSSMILTAKSPADARAWREAIEAEIQTQAVLYANAVRISRLYPGDLVGRPLNLLGEAQKSDVSVFTRLPDRGVRSTTAFLPSSLETNTGGPTSGPPCLWRSSTSSRSRATSGWDSFSVKYSEYRVQTLRVSRDNFKAWAESCGKLKELDRFFKGTSRSRISCSRRSMRWLATKRAKGLGYHVVWIKPAAYYEAAKRLLVKPGFESSAPPLPTKSPTIASDHYRAATLRFTTGAIVLRPATDKNESAALTIPFRSLKGVGTIDISSMTFSLHLRGDPPIKVPLKSGTYNDALGTRQAIFSRLAATSSRRRPNNHRSPGD